jgi:hypothetical protein
MLRWVVNCLRTTCGPIEHRAVGSKACFSLIISLPQPVWSLQRGFLMTTETIVGSSGKILTNCDGAAHGRKEP